MSDKKLMDVDTVDSTVVKKKKAEDFSDLVAEKIPECKDLAVKVSTSN